MLEQRSFIDSTKNALFDQLLNSLNQQFGNGDAGTFALYQQDPVKFGEQVLNETFTDDVKTMMESVRDYAITIAKSANATGKTHAAARVAVWFYKAFPDCQVYTAAAPPESNLKKLLWGEIGSLSEKHPDLFKEDTMKSLHIERSAKSFVTGVTIPMSGTEAQRQAKFSGKHAPYLLFILDEGDAIPDEVYTAIESCLSGGHGRLLVMFNPRSESGEVYRMERDGRANVVSLSAFNHPNVISGEDRIPGAVTREITVRRINQWCRPLASGEQPDSECFQLPDFLVGEVGTKQNGVPFPPLNPGWYKIMEPVFSVMVLGQYPAQSSTALISKEWINAARARWDAYVLEHGETPPAYTQAIMGLDVAEFGADSNVAAFRYGGFVERLISWAGVDTMTTADRATAEYKGRSVQYCNVDGTGIGAGVAPAMQRNSCVANSTKVASRPTESTEMGEFHILRDQLWWACREWLRTDSGAMLPPDEGVVEELMVATYEIVNGKIKVMPKATMRELLKRSPDKADALCLTFAPEDKSGRIFPYL
ncbi:hypothetical protein [uncultured Desulfobacter sp.]|uniref:hypothetical protein n=1 Tax=uncultured Desulfobacter sp. TaxID=240139 RepID=UPI002AAAA73B|nr:hypothetical protein [uncultured Desulfobacter sp.]